MDFSLFSLSKEIESSVELLFLFFLFYLFVFLKLLLYVPLRYSVMIRG